MLVPCGTLDASSQYAYIPNAPLTSSYNSKRLPKVPLGKAVEIKMGEKKNPFIYPIRKPLSNLFRSPSTFARYPSDGNPALCLSRNPKSDRIGKVDSDRYVAQFFVCW